MMGDAGGRVRIWNEWSRENLLREVTFEQRFEGGERLSHPAVKEVCTKQMTWSVQRPWGARGTAKSLEWDE